MNFYAYLEYMTSKERDRAFAKGGQKNLGKINELVKQNPKDISKSGIKIPDYIFDYFINYRSSKFKDQSKITNEDVYKLIKEEYATIKKNALFENVENRLIVLRDGTYYSVNVRDTNLIHEDIVAIVHTIDGAASELGEKVLDWYESTDTSLKHLIGLYTNEKFIELSASYLNQRYVIGNPSWTNFWFEFLLKKFPGKKYWNALYYPQEFREQYKKETGRS